MSFLTEIVKMRFVLYEANRLEQSNNERSELDCSSLLANKALI